MTEQQFTHLHVHSEASLMDGLGTTEALVKRAKELGFEALALTDHGTLAGTVSFVMMCERYGVKPIVGVEGYIAYGEEVGHITLLCDGNRGWDSLVKLQNLAHAGPYVKRPAFTVDQLLEHSDGIICLSGCPASPFHRLPYKEALRLTARFQAAFGNRFFIEVMLVGDAELWDRPLQLARDTGIKSVLTNDVHFTRPEYAKVHNVLTSIRAGFSYNSHQLWLKTEEELLDRMHEAGVDLREPMRRAWRLGKKIKPVSLARKPWLPYIEDADGKVEQLVRERYERDVRARLVSEGTDETTLQTYDDRLTFELGVITSLGFSTYFLILDDITSWARNNGVKLGPGRGSGAASLVLHSMGITKADPIAFKLSFERFLNPGRKGFPDVDIDLDTDGRYRVLEYAAERWGSIGVATFSAYKHRSLVHDLAKHFHIPRELHEAAADYGEDSDAFKQVCETYPDFALCYSAMRDQTRHKGKHPGGIIITDGIVPIERTAQGVSSELVAAWSEGVQKELSYAGLVKFDMLGLTALTALKLMEEEMGVEAPMPYEDAPEYELFREGDVHGIFQFSGSDGIARLTRRIAPTRFDDIVAATALYRPGALDVGTADKYPEWKRSPRKLHPLVDEILEPTYGIIVYQEQVMAIYAAVTGGTLADADSVRRKIIISHPGEAWWEEEIAELHDRFVEGAKRTIGEALGRKLWGEIISHSRYCLAADTVMHDGRTVEQWHHGGYPHAAPSLNEKSGEIVLNKVVDVVTQGEQIVYEIELEDGRTVKATEKHRFLTPDGWKPVRVLMAEMADGRDAELWAAESAMPYSKVKSIKRVGPVQTYDVSMAPPHHSFVLGNGILSHNSFNAGHAVSYSIISFWMAWWKRNYPITFYTALLNTDPSDAFKHIFDAVMHGIQIVPPHVNHSGYRYSNDGKRIFLPLSAVKFLGEPAAQAIVNAREERPFESFADFVARVPKRKLNARPRRGLLMLGAFDGVPGSEGDLELDVVREVGGEIAAQQEYLGYVIPTAEMIEATQRKVAKGEIVGIITEIKNKKSPYGPYKVYRLMPSGSFWSRDHDLKVGDIVKVRVKANSGRALLVKRLKA